MSNAAGDVYWQTVVGVASIFVLAAVVEARPATAFDRSSRLHLLLLVLAYGIPAAVCAIGLSQIGNNSGPPPTWSRPLVVMLIGSEVAMILGLRGVFNATRERRREIWDAAEAKREQRRQRRSGQAGEM